MEEKEQDKKERDQQAKKQEEMAKRFVNFFSPNALINKLSTGVKKLGTQTVYSILLLFYAYKKKDTPAWAKRVIIGILGYFIAPIDAIPDLSPFIGYTDDIGLIGYGLVMIAAYIDDPVRQDAKAKLMEWFSDIDDSSLDSVDKKL
jgi:uncharacterized membrane protein YkvA (DUF1232 family)